MTNTVNFLTDQFNRENITAANSGFALCGVTCNLEVCSSYFTFVVPDSFVLRKPALLLAAKRQNVKTPPTNVQTQKIPLTIFLRSIANNIEMLFFKQPVCNQIFLSL